MISEEDQPTNIHEGDEEYTYESNHQHVFVFVEMTHAYVQ